MVFLPNFICAFTLLFSVIKPISSLQFYDNTNCSSQSQVPDSNYLCINATENSCQTFIIYRAQKNFATLSTISSLFNSNETQLHSLNNINQSTSHALPPGREIIVPVYCSCFGRFSQALFKYNSSGSDSFARIACEVYESLVKARVLEEENSQSKDRISGSVEITVPVRCACPNGFDTKKGIQYLVTYPVVEFDNSELIARKFGVPEQKILAANSLEPAATIYPTTTLLIPTEKIPALDLELSSAPSPTFVIPLEKVAPGTSSKRRNLHIVLGVSLAITVGLLIAAFGICVHFRRKWHPHSFQPLSPKSLKLSSFSPDLLDGMSKLKNSLLSFSLEELHLATRDFCEALAIGNSVYKGKIGGSHLAIEKMDSVETAQQVLEILTRINHLNIVQLEGFCYGTMPYLIYKLAENGCLRDCLSNAKVARELTWTKRMQTAFDVAVGLHYIHYCTSPSYFHRNINSRNILITMDWRAKISGFKWAKTVICSEVEKAEINWYEPQVVGNKGYLAPEYFYHGLASPKVDVFAFGVVLLELLSAKEAVMDEVMLKDSVGFLLEGGLKASSGCLEKLKEFMDPALQGDYSLGDAFCLALLAKGCLVEDPHNRPTMNDVLKALSRIA